MAQRQDIVNELKSPATAFCAAGRNAGFDASPGLHSLPDSGVLPHAGEDTDGLLRKIEAGKASCV